MAYLGSLTDDLVTRAVDSMHLPDKIEGIVSRALTPVTDRLAVTVQEQVRKMLPAGKGAMTSFVKAEYPWLPWAGVGLLLLLTLPSVLLLTRRGAR